MVSLEGIINGVVKTEKHVEQVLKRIRRPLLESWVVPITTGLGIGLEALNVGKLTDAYLVRNQYSISSTISNFGYNVLQQTVPLTVGVAGIALVALPAINAIYRYYRPGKVSIPYTGANKFLQKVENVRKFIFDNKIINNPLVLPALTGGAFAHLAAQYVGEETFTGVVKGIATAVAGARIAKSVYNHFTGKPLMHYPDNKISNSVIPAAYIISAMAIINSTHNFVKNNNFQRDQIPGIELAYNNPDVTVMKVSDAADFYAKEFDIDPVLLKSLIMVESGYNNFAVSEAGAHGLGQHKEENIDELNRLINLEKLTSYPLIGRV
jgi:hypothetical protein